MQEFGTGYNILFLELAQSSYKLSITVTSGVCIFIYLGIKWVYSHEYTPPFKECLSDLDMCI
jgi:hypothetical protein